MTCPAHCRLLKPRAQGVVQLEEMKTQRRAEEWSLPMLIRFVTLFGPPPHPPFGHCLPDGARGEKGPGLFKKRGDRDNSSPVPQRGQGMGWADKSLVSGGSRKAAHTGCLRCTGCHRPLTPALSRREREPVPSSAPGCANRPNWLPLPHPSPLPPGEGASTEYRARLCEQAKTGSLSPWERAGVRALPESRKTD